MHKSQRVLIIAPVGDDDAAIAALLGDKGLETRIYRGIEECTRQIIAASGALLLTEEALESPQLPGLLQVLREQPTWSELPVIVLTSGGESRRARLLDLAAAAAGPITLLERPISTRTLVRSVQVALRSRRRQYEVRDLFAKLKSLNRSLERRVSERTAQAVDRGVHRGDVHGGGGGQRPGAPHPPGRGRRALQPHGRSRAGGRRGGSDLPGLVHRPAGGLHGPLPPGGRELRRPVPARCCAHCRSPRP